MGSDTQPNSQHPESKPIPSGGIAVHYSHKLGIYRQEGVSSGCPSFYRVGTGLAGPMGGGALDIRLGSTPARCQVSACPWLREVPPWKIHGSGWAM